MDWNSSDATQTWTVDLATVTETDVLRWEIVDQGANENVIFYDISLYVR